MFLFQSIIYIEIYAVLLLATLVPIYAFLVWKIFGTKSDRVKFLTNFKSGCDLNDLFPIFDPLEKYWIVYSWGFRQMIAAIHERGSLSEVITWSIDECYHVSPSPLHPSLKEAWGWDGSLYWQKGLTFQVLSPFTIKVIVKKHCHVSLKKKM